MNVRNARQTSATYEMAVLITLTMGVGISRSALCAIRNENRIRLTANLEVAGLVCRGDELIPDDKMLNWFDQLLLVHSKLS